MVELLMVDSLEIMDTLLSMKKPHQRAGCVKGNQEILKKVRMKKFKKKIETKLTVIHFIWLLKLDILSAMTPEIWPMAYINF